jgi:flagellar hook protein FlgE
MQSVEKEEIMGISSTLYTAISGLQSNSQAMGVTGNNISNSNTTGFKSGSSIFSDVLASTISSSSGDSEIGRGSQLATVQTNFSQGTFESTESSTDLAIEGDGFFIVSAPQNELMLYTRNGSFSFDDEGYLTTADGFRVQGSLYNDNGQLNEGLLSDIQVDMLSQIPATQTENVTLTNNLDSSSDILGAFDITDPLNSSNYSTTSIIYDSLGTEHTATCFFTKNANQTWEWNFAVESGEISGGGTDDFTAINSGVLTFDEDGNLLTGGSGTSAAITWNNGSDPTQTVTCSFNTSQFDSDSTVISQNQDGYGAGEIASVDISAAGTVSALYSNGETVDVGMISLATFVNPNGLSSAGSSLYSATTSSGNPAIGYPGGSQGNIVVQSLELSNVDLAAEFVDLITIQNGYNASSKVITTVDEMLQEVLNLKR